MHERERIHRTRRVAVRQLHRQRRLALRNHTPRRPPREAVLPQRELTPVPRVVMLAARQVVEADHREQQRIPRPHLLRVTVHHRLPEVQRIHETVFRSRPRITQQPATEFGGDDGERSGGVRDLEKFGFVHGLGVRSVEQIQLWIGFKLLTLLVVLLAARPVHQHQAATVSSRAVKTLWLSSFLRAQTGTQATPAVSPKALKNSTE